LQGNTATSQSIPFSSAIDASITIGNAATVAAYTGIAIDHLNSLISITAAVTKQKLYDYLALEKASFADSGVTAGGNPVPKCCLPTLADFIYTRSTGIFAYNLSLSSPAADPTGVDGLALSAGKNITLNAAGDYSAYPIDVSTTSTLFVSIGNSSLLGWTLPLGTSITRIGATGSAIVTVAADQLANVTAGAGVTLQSPQLTLQITTTIGASVSIRAASTNALIANGTADGTGTFTAAYSGSSLSAILRVRKAGYIPIQNTVAITSAGLTASAVLFADGNYNPTY